MTCEMNTEMSISVAMLSMAAAKSADTPDELEMGRNL